MELRTFDKKPKPGTKTKTKKKKRNSNVSYVRYYDHLTKQQMDVLGEVANISMGNAATTLSMMLNHPVNITFSCFFRISWTLGMAAGFRLHKETLSALFARVLIRRSEA